MENDSDMYVTYKINDDVGNTNFLNYHDELSPWSFNCYTFAIGFLNEAKNPGYYSGRELNLSSLSGVKLNVEKDQESLSRTIYDSNVSVSIPSHAWKIALRIKSGVDYHFMKINNTFGAAWQQKSGMGGPLLQLLDGKTPSQVTWDTYKIDAIKQKYVVDKSNFYNSAINYMIIKD